uniref:Uncharacterized protein n=1 Tax=Arundo donax TaxID=35708 RepID=A0A0A8XP86_ARUDO
MGGSASGWPRGPLPSGRPARARAPAARELRGGAGGGGALVVIQFGSVTDSDLGLPASLYGTAVRRMRDPAMAALE